jgi:hypothetical protein
MPHVMAGIHPVWTDKLLEAGSEIVYGFAYTVNLG